MDDDLPQPDDPCPGAAEALYSSEPVIVEARKLIDSGRFSDARALLDRTPTKPAEELCEIISRIEVAYRTTPAQLLAKLQPTIAEITSEDLKRWTNAGEVQFRDIDSQLLYFNREPANLFRFCAEAKGRRAGLLPTRKKDLHAHLRQIIEAAERSNDTLLLNGCLLTFGKGKNRITTAGQITGPCISVSRRRLRPDRAYQLPLGSVLA